MRSCFLESVDGAMHVYLPLISVIELHALVMPNQS
jgi:hypothetical protein